MVDQGVTKGDARGDLAALEFDRFARCHCGSENPRIAENEVYKASQIAEMTKVRKGLKIPKLAPKFDVWCGNSDPQNKVIFCCFKHTLSHC